ncbi:Lysozyme RrrD [compost metagenome]
MKTSQRGIDLIKRFEGFELEAYQDSVGVWTIGYGHTIGVKPGDRITQAQADLTLMRDLTIYETGVSNMVLKPITQGQFDALVSFAFNLGIGALGKSTLLQKLNAGDPVGAVMEFQRWVYAGGKKLNGLVKRREAERDLFVSA